MFDSCNNKILVFIRHGLTEGNLKKRYIGRTDEGLCEKGILDLEACRSNYPEVELVFSSPLRRCLETSRLIYPILEPRIMEDFREKDFGSFENKSYEDLKDNEAYMAWVRSNGTLPFPEGEGEESFVERSFRAYERAISYIRDNNIERAAFIIHGGTIMSIMSKVWGGSFYDYQVPNGRGFIVEVNPSYSFNNIRKL